MNNIEQKLKISKTINQLANKCIKYNGKTFEVIYFYSNKEHFGLEMYITSQQLKFFIFNQKIKEPETSMKLFNNDIYSDFKSFWWKNQKDIDKLINLIYGFIVLLNRIEKLEGGD